jgi:signal transduction histidine kinase
MEQKKLIPFIVVVISAVALLAAAIQFDLFALLQNTADQNLILFIVVASSSVVLLLIAILFDLLVLFRKRKVIAAQEIELRQTRIDELIMKKEVESVNALLKGQNTERRRISQELHDRLGGILFTAKLYNTNIEKKIKALKTEHDAAFEKLSELLDEAVQEVRRISHDLYSGSISNFGYAIAMQQLINALVEANGIQIKFTASQVPETLDEKLQFDLYAVTQEMLSNSLKHSGADQINIELSAEGQIDLKYHDNGKGFNTDESYQGIGLRNIRERVERHNGTLTVESSAQKGSSFIITIPLNA